MVGSYREEQLGEGQPRPWAGEFRVADEYINQEGPVTGKDWGMQGEASHQVHFDMLKMAPQLLVGKLLPVAITLGGTCLQLTNISSQLEWYTYQLLFRICTS